MKLKRVILVALITSIGGLGLVLIVGLFAPRSVLVKLSGKNSSLTVATNNTTNPNYVPGSGQSVVVGTGTGSTTTPNNTGGTSTGSSSTTPGSGGATTPPPTQTTPPKPTAPPTAIGSFSASPASISYNSSSTLSWSTSNATSCSITPSIGPVAVNGSRSTGALTSSVTFTLSCSGNGTVSKQAGVTVGSPPPACGQAGGTCTAAQVATHNSQGNCWMTYGGKWYVVTSYVSTHKGGASVFNSTTCGQDVTPYMNGSASTAGKRHTHSSSAYNTLKSFTGGPVV